MILPVKRRISLNEFNKGFLHVIVNGSVTLESNASVGMTRHRSHYIRVFDLTVKITDKSSSGYVRSSHIADWCLLFLPCPWVNHGDNTIYPGTLQEVTYCHVELEVKTSGEKRFVLTMVMAIDNSHRLGNKRNPYNSP